MPTMVASLRSGVAPGSQRSLTSDRWCLKAGSALSGLVSASDIGDVDERAVSQPERRVSESLGSRLGELREHGLDAPLVLVRKFSFRAIAHYVLLHWILHCGAQRVPSRVAC